MVWVLRSHLRFRVSDAPFLERLKAADAEALRSIAVRRRYPAGATLFLEADVAHDVFLIERGDVSILLNSLDGRTVVVDVASTGALLGELSAIDGGPRSATAVALNDVEILSVPTRRFGEFLDACPGAQRALLQLLADRLRGATRRQLEFGTVDALGRVCARIDEMAQRFGRAGERGIVIEAPISQSDLGNWAGLSARQ